MLKCFPIEFIRQILEQKLEEEHLKNVNYFGGKEQVAITSFYEQLKSQAEVDRFIETYRDLSNQQNRTGLVLNGVILSPENPSITNLYSSLIVPMTWTCSLRCTLEDRDNSIITINNIVDKLKGKKVDIAQLNCIDENGKPYSTPFCVGTIGQNDGALALKDLDFIGDNYNSSSLIKQKFDSIINDGIAIDKDKTYCLYTSKNQKLIAIKALYNGKGNDLTISSTALNDISVLSNYVLVSYDINVSGSFATAPDIYIQADITLTENTQTFTNTTTGAIGNVTNKVVHSGYVTYTVEFRARKPLIFVPTQSTISNIEGYQYQTYYEELVDDGTYKDIIVPPEHNSFERYKVSLSFDAIRCDEPRNLNEKEYCELSFGGSATLVSEGVQLGNDLLKINVSKIGINAKTPIDFANNGVYPNWWLEPLEMPSGNNADTQLNQLMSNHFINNSHTDALSITLQYTFIYDKSIDLLKQLFRYARYGIQGVTSNDISPNMIFRISEIWSSWGIYELILVKAKIVENVDIENTESDTLTLSLTMQIQGEND